MAPPPGDTAGAGGPVPPAPGSLFLSSPEPGLRSSNWDSEPGLFLALARLQEGVSSRPLRWLLFFLNIYPLMKLFIEAAHGPCLASCPSPSFGGGGIFLPPRLDVTPKYPAGAWAASTRRRRSLRTSALSRFQIRICY